MMERSEPVISSRIQSIAAPRRIGSKDVLIGGGDHRRDRLATGIAAVHVHRVDHHQAKAPKQCQLQ